MVEGHVIVDFDPLVVLVDGVCGAPLSSWVREEPFVYVEDGIANDEEMTRCEVKTEGKQF
jgi:hypothetical protein